MVEFKRKKGESFENFLRRFNKKLKESGKLYEARQKSYQFPKKTKRQQKQSALIGQKIRKEKEYLRKIGKLKEERNQKW